MNFFAPRLSEYNTEQENLDARRIRLAAFESIVKEQFQLTYFGHIGYDVSNDLSIHERHTLYRVLVEQKQEERKAHEEALRNAKANSKNGNPGWKRKR